VNGDNNVSEEITNRLIACNKSYFGLKIQFKSQLLPRKTKILMYKTLVRPILTYAAETWTTIKNDERRLSILERKNPSKIILSSMRERAVAEEIQ
jgi:hypothetical protein